jgi:hypothetical protein
VSSAGNIVALRQQLAQAERGLRSKARAEAQRLAQAEREAWLAARNACRLFDRAKARREQIRGGSERFPGEERLVEMALATAADADAIYTLLSFGSLADRLRFLRGGASRTEVIQETIDRGGVYTDRQRFQEIVR